MDSKELQLIIKCGETSTAQFKERFPNQDSIASEMVAMSNASGGMILFGIKDKTGGMSFMKANLHNIRQDKDLILSANWKYQKWH